MERDDVDIAGTCGQVGHRIGERTAGRRPGLGRDRVDDLLFPAPRGAVLRVRAARRGWFDRAAIAAGVPGLNPSELRHTAASLAVHAGAHVLAVQRMLGHEKASMTLDVYSDLFDGDLDLVAERLDVVRSRGAADFLRSQASKAPLRLA